MERELTWDGWADRSEDAFLTSDGQAALRWALEVVREFFGETWLADNAARSGFVPLLHPQWWPHANARVVVRIVELAARIALATAPAKIPELLREARQVHANRDLAATKFRHLCLTLETAAFAALAGWSVSYELASPSGRRPDLTVSRNGVTYSVEVTTLGLDHQFRAIDHYSDRLHLLIGSLEREHHVEITCQARDVLPDDELSGWLQEITQACQATAADGARRSASHGASRADIFAAGGRPPGPVFSCPMITGDTWRRVAVRIAEKAKQTIGGSAWLRIDDTGALLRLTDRSAQPLPNLLADLHLNVSAALAESPHVRGIILSDGATIDPARAREQTAWHQVGPAMLISPEPPLHVLADGPAAMVRRLPGGRFRRTFVLPGPSARLILPTGAGLEPGLWYHHEPAWLSKALKQLGHAPPDHLFHE
jgi:hypothetical protein